MRSRERLERVLKDLDTLSQSARAGLVGADTLDDKVKMSRTKSVIDTSRHALLALIFDVEDAEKFSENTMRCGECSNVVLKRLAQ